MSVLFGNGAGGFTPTEWATDTSLPDGTTQRMNADNRAAAAGDLDGDGHVDLLVGANSNFQRDATLAVLRADPGRVRAYLAPEVSRTGVVWSAGPSSIAVGDLDEDGRPDLVFGSPARIVDGRRLQRLPGRADGSLGPPVDVGLHPCTASEGGLRLAVADIDRDGHLDVVCGGNAPGAGTATASRSRSATARAASRGRWR